MKIRKIFFLLLFSALILFGGGQNALVVVLPFAISERIPRGATARLGLADQAQQELLSLELSRGRVELFGSDRSSLLQCRVEMDSGRHQLLLRLLPDKTELVLDGVLVGRIAAFSPPARPQVLFQPAARISAWSRPRVQKLATIAFADDFARDGVEDLQWEVQQGNFALNMNRNPGSSQGAFQLWGACPEGTALALADASRWFWQDYRCGASLLPDAQMLAWGVIFCWQSEQDYHLFRLVRDEIGGRGEFLRVRQGKETMLASKSLPTVTQSWQRLEVLCRDGQMRGFVGGREILQCRDNAATGGRIGIYGRQAQQFFVDDVQVSSISQEEFQAEELTSPFGPCEQLWNDFSDKHFAADLYMASWAQPRSFWLADERGIFWFRNRFFHDVEFHWRGRHRSAWQRDWRLCLFSAGRDAQSGYCFFRLDKQVVLQRQGQEVARVELPPPAEGEHEVRARAADGVVSFYWNEQLLLSWEDPEFLNQGEVGVAFARPLPAFLNQARVLSTHRLDYSFEHAPAAWAVQDGTWQGLHRWACVPKWSFFGGRGSAGPQEVGQANAVLWNLRRIKGDFDLEIFAAPLEGTPQRAHFSWPVSINVAFAADGRDLGSGYNLLFGTCDVPSKLFWRGQEIASSDSLLDPTLRQRSTAWYHRMTQTWQHLRLQRREGRILIEVAQHDDGGRYLGLRQLFEVPAEELSEEGQFAVWTYGDNGIAIARATLAFADSSGAALPPRHQPPLQARLGDGIQAPEQYFRAANAVSGGLFTRSLSQSAVDLSLTPELQLSWRASADTQLSLFAAVRGQCAELVLTGPPERRPYSIFLGQAETQPAVWPGWQTTKVNLKTALRDFFPTGDLWVENLWLGSPYQTYAQIAGFQVNSIDAWYEYQLPQWQPESASQPPPARGLILHCHGRSFYDDFEESYGDWQRLGGHDGAALILDEPQAEAASGRCLRLLNQRIGGAAGAWVTRQKYALRDFPGLAFRYRLPPGIEQNLLVSIADRWREVRLNGLDLSWPPLGPAASIQPDDGWHQLEVNLLERLPPEEGAGAIIEALALADTGIMGSLQRTAWWVDEFQLIPALAPGDEITVWAADGSAVPAIRTAWSDSAVIDNRLELSPQSGNRLSFPDHEHGGWLHLQAQFAEGNWSRQRIIRYLRREPNASPPPAESEASDELPLLMPVLTYLPSDRLLLTDFEARDPQREELSRMGEFKTRREAWALLAPGQGPAGDDCGMAVNLAERGFFSVYLRQSAWDIRRWPCVAFDYRFALPGCALNLSLLVNDALSIVEWTGPNRPGNHFATAALGSAPPAQQDGNWHHCAFDLAELLHRKSLPPRAEHALLTGSELAFWATNHRGNGYLNPSKAILYLDNFQLYSERGRAPAFRWRQPPRSRPAIGYSYLFNQEEDAIPAEEINLQEQEISFNEVSPGEWYFHLRAVDKSRQWSPTVHRKIIIR